MILASFTVDFHGELPANAHVGDKLAIRGTVTIRRIGAELVDVTALGHDPEWVPAGLNVELYANRLDVSEGQGDKPPSTIEPEMRA